MSAPARRMLLVHAHPDDETITTGATMAHYAAQGVGVTLLTCTLGEQGEILVPRYALLEAEQADQLGGLRIAELGDALRALGVADQRFLGGAGRFRDSGMMGTEPNNHDRAFWRANADAAIFATAVADVVAVIREVRPQVVVTYDDFGDYGHPDHIMANRVTTAAVLAAADPAHRGGPTWDVEKFYWTATPRSVISAGYDAVARDGDVPFEVAAEPAFGVGDEVVTTVVAATDRTAAKREALAAHATQVLVHGDYFALSNRLGRQISGVEHYRLVRGELGETGPDGHETDLFAGVSS